MKQALIWITISLALALVLTGVSYSLLGTNTSPALLDPSEADATLPGSFFGLVAGISLRRTRINKRSS